MKKGREIFVKKFFLIQTDFNWQYGYVKCFSFFSDGFLVKMTVNEHFILTEKTKVGGEVWTVV